MNRTKKLIMALSAAVVLGVGAAAQAQESPPPAAAPPPSQSMSLGGSGAGIGVGAGVTLGGSPLVPGGFITLPAAQFVYDLAVFHVEGLFGFTSQTVNGAGDRGTVLTFGAGGWYHLHRGSASDFSLGALIAINTTSGPGPSNTITQFEPGATVRAFLTPNVALFARAGLVFLFGDTGGAGTQIALGGQPTGGFGFTYFFR